MTESTVTQRSWLHALRSPRAAILEPLRDWPWLDTARTLRVRFREDRLGLTAGSLTFSTLIALVPLLTVMLAVFSAFPMFSNFQVALDKYFLQTLVPSTIAKPVLSSLTLFAAKAKSLGTAGLVFFVVTAIAGMLTIDRALNEIWRVRRPRPIAQRVLVYWAALTLGPLLLGISLSMTSYALSASEGIVGRLPNVVTFVLNATQFLLLSIGMAGLFHYVPNTDVRWRHAIAGGLFVAIGFEIAKRLLGWYLRSVPTYAIVYGAFATLPIFLLWLYLGWVIVLLGAIIAAYAPSLQMRVKRRADVPGAALELAVQVLRLLAQARAQQPHGRSMDELSSSLRADPLQLEPVLETLQQVGCVGRLDDEGHHRYVLLCEPEHALAEPLVTKLWIDPALDLAGFAERVGMAHWTIGDLIATPGAGSASQRLF